MFGRNKRTHMDGSTQRASIQLLCKVTKVNHILNISLPSTDRASGHRIAQARVVFKIPDNKIDAVFPSLDTRPPSHLVYVEWFTPIPTRPEPKHQMYKVSR